MTIDSKEFREKAMAGRGELLKSLSFLNRQQGTGSAGTAYEVGQEAYKEGFAAEVKTPKGGLYDSWVKSGKIPAWAARAVASLLRKREDYSPRSQEELWSLLLMLAEGYDITEVSGLRTLVSGYVVDDEVLQLAIDSKKASYN